MRRIFIYVVLIQALSSKYVSLDQACNKNDYGKAVTPFRPFYGASGKVTWNPIEKFQANMQNVGQGGFGVVKRATFKAAEMSQSYDAIIKKVDTKQPGHARLVLNEINGLVDLINTGIVPKLFGCTLGSSGDAYLVQEVLDHTVDSLIFKKSFLTYTTAQSLQMHFSLFKSLETLWDKGYSHNDIKPENMMTDNDERRFYLIDLGLIDTNNGRILRGGTASFMSPSRFTGGVNVKPKDDMYSMAVSILIMEAKDGYDQVFGNKSGDYKTFPRGCRDTHLNIDCRNIIADRAKKILEKEYGTYQAKSTSLEIINFTTLITNMIYYDEFNYNYKAVTSAIQHLINEKTALTENHVQQVVKNQIGQQMGLKNPVKPTGMNLQPMKADKAEVQAYKQDKFDYNQARNEYLNLKNQKKEVSRQIKPMNYQDMLNYQKGNQQLGDVKANNGQPQMDPNNRKMELLKIQEKIKEAQRALENQRGGNLKHSNCYKEEGDLFKRRIIEDSPDQGFDRVIQQAQRGISTDSRKKKSNYNMNFPLRGGDQFGNGPRGYTPGKLNNNFLEIKNPQGLNNFQNIENKAYNKPLQDNKFVIPNNNYEYQKRMDPKKDLYLPNGKMYLDKIENMIGRQGYQQNNDYANKIIGGQKPLVMNENKFPQAKIPVQNYVAPNYHQAFDPYKKNDFNALFAKKYLI